jgi:hypothetical protein
VPVTTNSAPLAQEDVRALFAIVQAQVIELHNQNGRGCIVRTPTADELADVQTARELEALVRCFTRPLPSPQWRTARSPR